MCNADTNLAITHDYVFFGSGTDHKCKDFNLIREWAIENHFLEFIEYRTKPSSNST